MLRVWQQIDLLPAAVSDKHKLNDHYNLIQYNEPAADAASTLHRACGTCKISFKYVIVHQ